MKISEIITDKYKLRIPPTVYYDLLADVVEAEEEQEPILDKIRAEMLEEMLSHSGTGEEVIQAYADGLKKGLELIDKYKGESENP